MAYYVIHDFMYEDLKLGGTDLLVFSAIHSFGEYTGGLAYLCKITGARSINTIQSSLKRLVDNGYIIKTKLSLNRVSYSVNPEYTYYAFEGEDFYIDLELSNYKKPVNGVKKSAKELLRGDNKWV